MHVSYNVRKEMSDDNPQPLLPRSIIRQHIPGHSEGLQQDLPLWQHISMSQPQPAAGVQAVPVGIGFASRPQQQLWPDHTSQYSQRGWQPLPQPHTQQSPQESQDLNPQVVRSQHQNWQGAGDVNPLQLQQLQHLIWLQQQQQQQQQQIQQMQHHHQTEPSLHHVDTLGQHEDLNHDKFTKSPSPQVEETRHSPLTRPYVQNVTSPQQQLWQHPQILHQFDVQHSESPHSQAFQHTPTVSHHQQLFTPQQQYVQPVWQHAPYSQVQLQHLRQSTPPVQQHLLWQQQQQQQQQHQHQQQQQQQHQHQQLQQVHQQPQHLQQHNSDSLPSYSPTTSNQFSEKPCFPEKKDDTRTDQDTNFLGNRLSAESNAASNTKSKPYESQVNSVSNTGLNSTALPFSMSSAAVASTANQIRILSKSSQSTPSSDLFVPQTEKSADSFPSMTSSSSAQTLNQRSSQGGLFNLNSINTPPPQRPQNFNPNPSQTPYQNLNQTMANKNFTSLYGNQNRFQAPNKDIGMNSASPGNQFRPRSPNIRNQQPSTFSGGMLQRGPNIQPHAPIFNRMERMEVNLFVSGLNPRTSADSIRHYFEFVGRPAEVKDRVLFGIDHTDALVTFLQKPDVYKLKQNVRARKLDGFSLEIWEVPPPRAIVVSSDVAVRSVDSLVNYFEKESIGGGTMKKNAVDETEDGCCILEFEDYRVIQRLCLGQKQHRVDGILLRVSPYFRCENGAIWDTTLHMVPVPKPVNIQILPDQLEFVKKQCQAQFSTRMREKFADVTYSKDHVTVKCTLRQSMPNYRMLVRGWETGVQEAVAKFLGETIDQADVVVPDVIWDKFIEWLNAGRADSKDILIKQDRERKHLKLVGHRGNLKNSNQLITQKVEALARAARRKTEVRKVKSTEKLVVVDLQGTIGAICKKYIDMKIRVDGNEVTVEGDPADIPNAFKDLYNECDKIEPFTYKHNKSREFTLFCKREPSRRFIQRRLDQKLIRGAWTISSTEISMYTHRKADSEIIKNLILDSIREDSIPVDKTSTSLLNSEVWGDFVADKSRRYKDKVEIYVKKQLQSVLIVGTCDVIHNLIQQIRDFLDEKTVKTVLVSCDPVVLEFISACWTENDFNELQKCDVVVKKKANGLELTGLSEKLIAAKLKLDTKLKRLCSKRHPIKRIGIYEVIDTLRHSGTISAIERDCKCVMKLPAELEKTAPLKGNHFDIVDSASAPEDAVTSSGPRCFQTKNHKIKIRLVHGEIATQKTDIIVCNAASSLNLKSGSASYSLVKTGGNQLQVDCNRLYPNGIADGDVAVIDGGNLSCDQVYLTSLPGWRDIAHTGGKVFRDFMREAIRLADCSNKKSISFLAIGCGGFLGYPRELVIRMMYGVVVEFDSSYSRTSLKDISIVIGSKDAETIKAFEDHEHMRIHGCSSAGPLSSDFVKGRIKIELVTDDLSKQQVDALLCSVATDMNLTRNAICKSLVEVGGRTLQEECKQKYNNELVAGKVVDISGASLPCKTIYLTVLPTYTDSSLGEQNMIGVLQTTLQLANLKGYQSIAIPALGTGHCSYPKNISAKCMYDAALDWAAKNPKASLKLVRFVMYSKDTEAQQAFRACHQKILGREIRASRSLQGDGAVSPSKMAAAKYRMVQNGCMLDTMKLSVVCGDIVAATADILINPVGTNFDMSGTVSQALVKQCPNILPECQQKKTELRREGIVLTGASELKAKYIIHVLNQDSLNGWRNKVVACLEEASKKSAVCLAIPLLGTGPGGKQFVADIMAECLFCAVDDFFNRHPKTTLTEVQVVVGEQNQSLKAAVLSAFQEKVTSTMAPHNTSSRWQKRQPMERSGGNQHSAMSRHRAMSEMTVVVHSDAILNIDRCIRGLDDKVALEYCRKTVEADTTAIKSLSDKQIDNILDSSLLLDIKLDRKTGKFSVHGPFRSVLTAIDTIHTRLQVYTNEQQSKGEAETLAGQVRWHYEESGALEKREMAYDIMINLVIERAYLAGKSSVELVDTEKRQFVIDFQRLVEYRKEDKSDVVRVIRKDVVKGDAPVPSNWMSMSNNENVKKVTLATNDREYQKVEKQLLSQLRSGLYASKMKNKQNIQVLKIERIQNRSLYQQFAARKKSMEQQRTGKQVERQLWQCSLEENLASIVNHGFNRSYCGTNGVLYGQGVYFGVDASHSVQPYVGGSKPGTKRYIFLVRSLTGEFMKGNPSLRVLPPVNASQPAILYDSAVDDTNKPMEFVMFHDAQAYPEYLITFAM